MPLRWICPLSRGSLSVLEQREQLQLNPPAQPTTFPVISETHNPDADARGFKYTVLPAQLRAGRRALPGHAACQPSVAFRIPASLGQQGETLASLLPCLAQDCTRESWSCPRAALLAGASLTQLKANPPRAVSQGCGEVK